MTTTVVQNSVRINKQEVKAGSLIRFDYLNDAGQWESRFGSVQFVGISNAGSTYVNMYDVRRQSYRSFTATKMFRLRVIRG